MELPDELLCVFSAEVDEDDGSYTITLPEREFTNGPLSSGGVYRVAVVGSTTTGENSKTSADQQSTDSKPPVETGEHRTVEIDAIGEQGDGIARVERGYVIIVPDTEKREQVVIEIVDVKPNVAFGEIIERKSQGE